MTRKQAEKLSGRIVAAAREAGKGSPNWTSVNVTLSAADVEAIDNNIALVVGVMPIGWRLTGKQGAATLTVVRSGL